MEKGRNDIGLLTLTWVETLSVINPVFMSNHPQLLEKPKSK
jgi:hypothetical protein